MNILHLVYSIEPGGRREAIRTLAQRQQQLAVRSDLCCLSHLGCPEAVVADTFDRIFALSNRGLMDVRAIGRLYRFCAEREIDVIHTHDASSQALASLVRILRPRLKVLMTFHRSLGFESASVRDRVRNALASSMCGAVVVGSCERREHFLRENHVSKSKLVRIPFGIDLQRFRPDPTARDEVRRSIGVDDGTFVLGAAGHFGNEKGIDVVLRAFGQLLRYLPPGIRIKLVVLGDGSASQQAQVRALAAETGGDHVMLAGFRRDAERWFNGFDVFVHGARKEAFGLVLAEAMATGLPVVATSVGGIPDIVRSGLTGLLVRSDDVAALGSAVERVLTDAEFRKRASTAAQTIAKAEFSDELYARRYLTLYQDLVSGRVPLGIAGDQVRCETPATRAAQPESSQPTQFSDRGAVLCPTKRP
jgi:glycosyltransferase involved in cell wall biosynthesis